MQAIDRVAYVQAEIGCDLLVATAPAVQLVTGLPDLPDELFLDKVVNIFGLFIVQKGG